jgi:hypothetical protein
VEWVRRLIPVGYEERMNERRKCRKGGAAVSS